MSRSSMKHGVVLGVFLFFGFILQTIGLRFTTASKSAFFTGMLTVFTPIIHYAAQHVLSIERRYLKMGNIIGVVCSAIGLFLLTSPAGGEFNIGDALSLGCALMFSCYIVYLDYASAESETMSMTWVMFFVCGLAGLLCAFLFEDISTKFSPNFVISLLYLTIFATVITMAIQNRFQSDTTPTRAAVIFAMEPVVAGILAYFVRGENLGITGFIGAAIILSGLLLSEFSDELPLLNRTIR